MISQKKQKDKLFFSPFVKGKLCRQQTLRRSVFCEGIGVHSGKKIQLWMHPAPENHGIKFIRSDIKGTDNLIKATWSSVTDTVLCTKLSNKSGVSLSTVEHLMAALSACQIHNVLLEVNGPEIPIMDGSADPFYKMIQEGGIQEQNHYQPYIKVLKPVRVEDGNRSVTLTPDSSLTISFDFDFQGRYEAESQRFVFKCSPQSFEASIGPARTFGFVEDVENLRKAGLALGASLENAVGLSNGQVLNAEGLRYKDEFVRHKILDALGDLYLAGAPLVGAYHGVRAGHLLNHKILQALFADSQAFMYVTEEVSYQEPMSLPFGRSVSLNSETPVQALVSN